MAAIEPRFLTENRILTETIALTATAAEAIFVTEAGALAASAGAKVAGVCDTAGVSGDHVPVTTMGIDIVRAGGAITVGADVSSNTSGYAVASSGLTNPFVAGTALDAATGSGTEYIRVRLKSYQT